MKELSEKQQQIVDANDKHILVVAGPGSGKTQTTVARIARLLCKKNPESIAAITFTVNAANELKKRLLDAMTQEGKRLAERMRYVGTLHGFCLRLIQEHPEISGYHDGLGVIDNEDAEELLKEKAAAMKYRGSTSRLLDIKSGSIKAPSPHSLEYLVIQAYQRELRSTNTIDFDQILEVAHKVVTARGGYTGVDLLFVDEFQDVGYMDALIYGAMRCEKFFVGDPDQAIYGFRGGDITAILAAANSPAWETFALENNYRSGVTICRAATKLIANNKNRVDKITRPLRPEAGEFVVREFKNDVEEMRALVEELLKVPNIHETAILCRTNKLAESFAITLQAMGLNVRAKRDEIPDDWPLTRALALFTLNPNDARLGARLLEFQHGKDEARRLTLEAKAAGKTINQIHFNMPELTTTSGTAFVEHVFALTVSARFGTSAESIALLKETMGTRNWDTKAQMGAALIEAGKQVHEEGQGVTVTTIHGSKGREFDTVYLPGWDQEIFPGTKQGADLEEERRLAFVGITRAKNKCVVMHAHSRRNPYTNRVAPSTPSIFIREAM